MDSRKSKEGKESKHKTKSTLMVDEATQHNHSKVDKIVRDSMVILEEQVWSVWSI